MDPERGSIRGSSGPSCRALRVFPPCLDDTGDELLKRRAEPLISQLKQRRLWQGANRIADAREHEINIKQPLCQEERVPFCQACSQVPFSTSLEKLYTITA
jgi:hypothetical protein